MTDAFALVFMVPMAVISVCAGLVFAVTAYRLAFRKVEPNRFLALPIVFAALLAFSASAYLVASLVEHVTTGN